MATEPLPATRRSSETTSLPLPALLAHLRTQVTPDKYAALDACCDDISSADAAAESVRGH